MLHEIYNLFGYNKGIFIIINSTTNFSILPNILQAISKVFFIGNFAIAYAITVAFLAYKIIKSQDRQASFNTYYYEMVRVGIIYTIFGLSYAAMKFSFNLPRPFCSLQAHEFLTILDTNKERCLSSFPSAHTALSLLVCYFLWPYSNKITKLVLLTLVCLSGLSRITLAMHYPSDIIFSLIIATIIFIVGNKIYILLKDNLVTQIGAKIFNTIFSKLK